MNRERISRCWTLVVAASVLSFTASSVQAQEPYCPDYVGKFAPELQVAANGWINTESDLSLEKLRGHVVWLEFSFLACGGCRMMKPILHGMQHEFGRKGLVVVEVNNGKIDSRDAVARAVAERQPNHAVLWDEGGRTCEAYGIRRYGTAYLIGADGRVIWGGNPITLKVSELWMKISFALGGVDLDALARRGGAFPISVTSVNSPHQVQERSPGSEKRYDMGAAFTICTDDNSMVIDGVRAGSPCEQAGLRKGDAILSIDEMVLKEVPFETLKERLHELEKGPRRVRLGVERQGRRLELVVDPPDGSEADTR